MYTLIPPMKMSVCQKQPEIPKRPLRALERNVVSVGSGLPLESDWGL